MHAVKCGISGLLHLETTCIRSALLENMAAHCCHDFLGVDIGFLLESLFFVQFGLAFWQRICVSAVRSQFG